ncbi:hypothetical protein NEISICOT_00698 [Neisseria sicca ATCC 29256]|uniref:Uncharacterized protein n=1 Tax=Neisseria sicca ATCC 29256 TaxID=547045 RepID=C6M2F9_NEISI|nr:hypothetical protein NEISICOT_00698 [Neisseria sicca ATCC 29256]
MYLLFYIEKSIEIQNRLTVSLHKVNRRFNFQTTFRLPCCVNGCP